MSFTKGLLKKKPGVKLHTDAEVSHLVSVFANKLPSKLDPDEVRRRINSYFLKLDRKKK